MNFFDSLSLIKEQMESQGKKKQKNLSEKNACEKRVPEQNSQEQNLSRKASENNSSHKSSENHSPQKTPMLETNPSQQQGQKSSETMQEKFSRLQQEFVEFSK